MSGQTSCTKPGKAALHSPFPRQRAERARPSVGRTLFRTNRSLTSTDEASMRAASAASTTSLTAAQIDRKIFEGESR